MHAVLAESDIGEMMFGPNITITKTSYNLSGPKRFTLDVPNQFPPSLGSWHDIADKSWLHCLAFLLHFSSFSCCISPSLASLLLLLLLLLLHFSFSSCISARPSKTLECTRFPFQPQPQLAKDSHIRVQQKGSERDGGQGITSSGVDVSYNNIDNKQVIIILITYKHLLLPYTSLLPTRTGIKWDRAFFHRISNGLHPQFVGLVLVWEGQMIRICMHKCSTMHCNVIVRAIGGI